MGNPKGEAHRRHADRRGATGQRAVRALVGVVLLLSGLLGAHAPAGAAELPDGPGTITVDQGPVGPTGFCLPPFLSLTHSVSQSPTTFTLTITASPSLCEPVPATAVIYAMPTDGSAWPQQLAARQELVVRGPGVTTVTFHKGCLPAQFDVVTGATPSVISPTGEWHGPLLFPFALDSSQQFFGGDCTGSSCDDYTPTNVTVDPSSVAPGGTVTVAGNGFPGTTIDLLLRQPPGSPVPTGASVTVSPEGTWSVPVTVPADLAPGTWRVVAAVEGCQAATSADLTVTGGATTTTTTPQVADGDEQPDDEVVVAGATEERALPAASVAGDQASAADAAGLAFTGSDVRVPVVAAIGLLVAGTLLLLQRRRRA